MRIDHDGIETVADPETGKAIKDQAVVEFAEFVLQRFEHGESVEALAESTALDEFLVCTALDLARANPAIRCTA
ncbi:hypothetical protein [Amycolatopsis benzoatilytica]|uniref:hypothetical protein n=1 Tax=Amycolatopsis benzoatilytica TaxID=346045 RepID=UPI000380181B|nr:hypothetical protein [Amycolatopsis benzoatilytica]